MGLSLFSCFDIAVVVGLSIAKLTEFPDPRSLSQGSVLKYRALSLYSSQQNEVLAFGCESRLSNEAGDVASTSVETGVPHHSCEPVGIRWKCGRAGIVCWPAMSRGAAVLVGLSTYIYVERCLHPATSRVPLQSVSEERASVTQIQKLLLRILCEDLLFSLSNHVLVATPVLFGIDGTKHKSSDDSTHADRQRSTESGPIVWRFAGNVDLHVVSMLTYGEGTRRTFEPATPPMLPIEMSSAMPTALLDEGARLLPIMHTMQMKGAYNPAATTNKKA